MNKKEKQFVEAVLQFHAENARNALPWRKTVDPYKILVSEIMLQQTQVDRVMPKYENFIKKWSTVEKLAEASLGSVLTAWQGLGYNRRAKYLHACAKVVVNDYGGVFPASYKELQKLPGIGPYTAGAIIAFAHNEPIAIIETNIRTVYIHHFFKSKQDVSDAEILLLVQKTMMDNPRTWYAALMDYGTYVKKTVGNNINKSKSYKKQSVFKGSNREIRGAIIRVLTENKNELSLFQLYKKLEVHSKARVDTQVENLVSEKLIIQTKKGIRLS